MAEFTQYQPGTFCWVDLATTDAAGAKEFYGQFFGWELNDMPAGPDSVYTMAQLQGKTVAGLYAMNKEQQAQSLPPHWMSYISVSNAEEVATRAKSLGGQVLDEPFDVMEAGRMGIIQDPTGAVVALWQPGHHIGSQVANLPGSFTWNELATTDAEAAARFYSKLFGWSTQVQEMPNTTYTTFLNGERMAAGMLQMTEEWGDIPPHWMVYFAVEDCDAGAEKAASLGAKVHVPPTDIPPVGRFAVVEDPQGAYFTIIKLNNPE